MAQDDQQARNHVHPRHDDHQDEDHEHVEVQQVQPVEDLGVGADGGGGHEVRFGIVAAEHEAHPDLVGQVVHPHVRAVGRVHGNLQGGGLVLAPAAQALDVGQIRVHHEIVVHLQHVAVHFGHVELAHPDLFPDEISGHVVPFLQAGDGRETGGDGHAQAGVRTVGEALDQHAVDDVAAADDARPDGDRTDGLHPGNGQDGLFRRQVGRDGSLFRHDGRGRGDPDVAGQGRDAVPYGLTESGRDGYGDDNHQETHGDGSRREFTLELEFPRYEAVGRHLTRCGRAPLRDGTWRHPRGCRRRRRRSGSCGGTRSRGFRPASAGPGSSGGPSPGR